MRLYLLAVCSLGIIAILGGDRVEYLKFVNKETGAYMVIGFGMMIAAYRIIEWYFVYRKKS